MDLFLSSAVREVPVQLLQLEEREEQELWWSRSESPARIPHSLQQWKCGVITRPEFVCEGFSSTLTDPGVALAQWSPAHGSAITAAISYTAHIPTSAVPVGRGFILTIPDWNLGWIFLWSWNGLDSQGVFLQNTPLLSTSHLLCCFLWLFKPAEENNRCV